MKKSVAAAVATLFLTAGATTLAAPSSPAHATTEVPTGSGSCRGKFIAPAKPRTEDWANGQDLHFFNCTKTPRFAVVWCHPYPTFADDQICYARRIPRWSEVTIRVPWNRQVHWAQWR